MGRRKGDNAFKAMQTRKITEKVKLIKGYLALLPKGVKFDKYKDLEKYIVDKIGCAHTTITRQSAYTNEIVAKYADMNPDVDKIDPNNATPAQTRKLIDYYRVENASLKGDLQRKQKYFESAEYINEWLESNTTSKQPQIIPCLSDANAEPKLLLVDLENPDGTGNAPSWQQKYEVTCEALFLFITKMEKHWNIKYDRKAGTLLDAASDMEDEEYIEVYVPDPNVPQANLRYLREFLDKKGR
jgi:hypothetical protein